MHCARGPEPVAAIHLALGFIYLFENQHVKEEVVNWSNKYTIDTRTAHVGQSLATVLFLLEQARLPPFLYFPF